MYVGECSSGGSGNDDVSVGGKVAGSYDVWVCESVDTGSGGSCSGEVSAVGCGNVSVSYDSSGKESGVSYSGGSVIWVKVGDVCGMYGTGNFCDKWGSGVDDDEFYVTSGGKVCDSGGAPSANARESSSGEDVVAVWCCLDSVCVRVSEKSVK